MVGPPSPVPGFCRLQADRRRSYTGGAGTDFEVRIVDGNGHVLLRYTYHTVESARRAPAAWTVAFDNCPVEDTTLATKESRS